MSDFKAKMHQIRFRLGLRPRPRWVSLQCSPRPLARFKGPTSKRREGRGKEGREKEGKGEKERGWEGRGGEGEKEDPERSPSSKFTTTPLVTRKAVVPTEEVINEMNC